MKRRVLLLLPLLLPLAPEAGTARADSADSTRGAARAQASAASSNPLSAGDSLAGRNPAIVVGEKLTFSVRYGVVKAGTAVLSMVGKQRVGDRTAYRLEATTTSNAVFDQIYRVRDQLISLMDAQQLTSLYFEKHLREGNYKADQAVRFEDGMATYQDGRQFPIPPRIYDALAAFYRVRAAPLQVGQEFMLQSHADRKNYPIEVRVTGREEIDAPAGRFHCLKVEPKIRSGAFFKNEGQLILWLTDDARKMPVLMQSKIPVGSISVVLTDYVRPGEEAGAGGGTPSGAPPQGSAETGR